MGEGLKVIKIRNKILILSLILIFQACSLEKNEDENSSKIVKINSVEFEIPSNLKLFTWDTLAKDIFFQRQNIKKFTNKNGLTHFYEVIYLPSANLNWYQAAYLAQDAGAYLVSITSKEENDFILSLISNEKYFVKILKYKEHQKKDLDYYETTIGPFLGRYIKESSDKLSPSWHWLSGEKYEDKKENEEKYNKKIFSKKLYGFILEYEKLPNKIAIINFH